jgi:O-antigen/teichoic acid export membrane protein
VALGYGKVLNGYIAGRGRVDLTALGSVGGLFINLGANLILIPRVGLIGAAIATSISYTSIALFSYANFLRMTSVPSLMPLVPSGKDLADAIRRLFGLFGKVASRRKRAAG